MLSPPTQNDGFTQQKMCKNGYLPARVCDMTFQSTLIFCGHYNKARVFIFSNLHVKDAFEDSSRTMAVQSQKILLIL
jgi:hypothetical protein